MSATFRDYCQKVKDAALGQWPELLQALAGLSDQQVNLKTKVTGTDCRLCGGNDRYSFKDVNKGGWACRHCGGGDGWTMLERANGWSFAEAIRQVANYLGIEPFSGNRVFSPEERAAQQAKAKQRQEATQARQQQEAEQLRRQHDQKANYALQEWGEATPASPNHAHLVSHGLPPFDLRQIQHRVYGDCLLVPLFNEQGELRNLERINQKGLKRPIKGAQKKGCFYQFGRQTWTVYIAESWSTGAAIHIGCTSTPCVLASMSAGNIENIAAIALRRFPDSNIVIAADHDQPGIKAAVKAAKKHNLKIVIPEQEGADFCDLFVMERGREA